MSEGRQAPSPEESRKLVNFILKIDSVAFVIAGIIFMLKEHFTSYTLINEDMDIIFGAVLMASGIISYIVADKFFAPDRRL